jgi:hypothetical protein
LVFEQLSARDAVKQGRALVKPVRWQLADVLIPLWLIGWLIVGAPIFGGLWLIMIFFSSLSGGALEALTFLGSIAGSAFVAPLMALGASQFYLFVRDRSTQHMEATIDALYGDGAAAAAQSAASPTGEVV